MAFAEIDVGRCRRDFPALARLQDGAPLAFLDGPAGSQVPAAVVEAVSGYYRTCNANTHGAFATSRESDALIRSAREAVAAFLGAPSWREISFGANMTTLAFALSHALARDLAPGDEVVTTELDHEANRGPWLALGERGVTVREVALLPSGELDERDLRAKITPRTRLVAIGYASNALGTVNDVPLARRLSSDVGALLVVDAVHYAPHFPLDVNALDPDFLLCSAYKFYGPHVGILYCRTGLLDRLRTYKLRTQDDASPYRIETGTLNHAAIAGVKAAVEYIASWGDGTTLRERVVSAMSGIAAHEHAVAASYWDAVRRVPGVTAWGPGFDSRRRAPTVSITIEGVRPVEAAEALGRRGVLVWDGDFYAARAIEVLGLAESGGVLRTGISMYNTREEVERLLDGVARVARR
ncbi:MAG TPA: cysteine desulfurase-like protein [Thermoanaerobaculaceae bacterium]|nr:cysteine desulfurase-like protein [Thermoanaerobaculaceae bacterium]